MQASILFCRSLFFFALASIDGNDKRTAMIAMIPTPVMQLVIRPGVMELDPPTALNSC
jgi:hypothetical protein